jgi:hypothetical protein
VYLKHSHLLICCLFHILLSDVQINILYEAGQIIRSLIIVKFYQISLAGQIIRSLIIVKFYQISLIYFDGILSSNCM